ncbi:MAG: GPR endopeptidase [Ruminococcus sp.]|nr:GPR endopeptidase [Ruminococcus sp.]
MAVRTDLAIETARQLSLHSDIKGVRRRINLVPEAEAEISEITVLTDEAARLIGRPKGRYVTVRSTCGALDAFAPCFDRRCRLIASIVKRLCRGAGSVLAAGLGNRSITADSVGPLCCDRLFATRHIKNLSTELDTGVLGELSVIAPGVLGNTGIEATEQIAAVCGAVRPDAVIAVDALACSEIDHLGQTIQLCDTGIHPGSGVENSRKELSEKTLGVRCIAIGVPMVIDLSTAAEKIFGRSAPEGAAGMTVTPGSVDKLAASAAEYIAMGINLAMHPTLTPAELRALSA